MKKKRVVRKIGGCDALLCNRDILVSEQLEDALNGMTVKKHGYFFDTINIHQFGEYAFREMKNYEYQLMIIDYEIAGSMSSRDTIVNAKRYRDFKVLMTCSVINADIRDMIASGIIDGILLMPFQDTHVTSKVVEILDKKDEGGLSSEDMDEEIQL